jgi:hypothetical protein
MIRSQFLSPAPTTKLSVQNFDSYMCNETFNWLQEYFKTFTSIAQSLLP